MGEANFVATLSETLSEERQLYFEPVVPGELSLKRHSTLREGSIGAVDGAPSTCCAKHSSVNFFVFFERRVPCTKNCRETFRRPSEASRGLPEAF